MPLSLMTRAASASPIAATWSRQGSTAWMPWRAAAPTAGGEAGRARQRAERHGAIADGESRTAILSASIKIGVRGEKSVLLGLRRAGHAVDILVPVALDMRGADEGRQREVLLNGDAGLRGEVLRRHEVSLRAFLGVPVRHARTVEQGAIKALAGFRRNAAIAQRAHLREDADIGVGFIDLDRHFARQRMDRFAQRAAARNRLLDQQERRPE